MTKTKKCLKLFLLSLSVSGLTLGGGYVIVPLMRKKHVEKMKWIEEAEMLDMIAIASSAPGPIAVNTSIIAGHKIAGLAGALASLAGTILPPLLILSVVYVFYEAFRSNRYVASALWGMKSAVAALLADAVYTMVGTVAKEKDIWSYVVLAASFAAVLFLKLNAALALLAAAALGLLRTWLARRKSL
ncbi:MAG: chromate transporter [Clostridiales bacterium]|jgi:chromate transporter|nr:chromate transporter [Clostridiales bacterium]MDR2750218.1 chromate transporter [Clostridiales bacterium]